MSKRALDAEIAFVPFWQKACKVQAWLMKAMLVDGTLFENARVVERNLSERQKSLVQQYVNPETSRWRRWFLARRGAEDLLRCVRRQWVVALLQGKTATMLNLQAMLAKNDLILNDAPSASAVEDWRWWINERFCFEDSALSPAESFTDIVHGLTFFSRQARRLQTATMQPKLECEIDFYTHTIAGQPVGVVAQSVNDYERKSWLGRWWARRTSKINYLKKLLTYYQDRWIATMSNRTKHIPSSPKRYEQIAQRLSEHYHRAPQASIARIADFLKTLPTLNLSGVEQAVTFPVVMNLNASEVEEPTIDQLKDDWSMFQADVLAAWFTAIGVQWQALKKALWQKVSASQDMTKLLDQATEMCTTLTNTYTSLSQQYPQCTILLEATRDVYLIQIDKLTATIRTLAFQLQGWKEEIEHFSGHPKHSFASHYQFYQDLQTQWQKARTQLTDQMSQVVAADSGVSLFFQQMRVTVNQHFDLEVKKLREQLSKKLHRQVGRYLQKRRFVEVEDACSNFNEKVNTYTARSIDEWLQDHEFLKSSMQEIEAYHAQLKNDYHDLWTLIQWHKMTNRFLGASRGELLGDLLLAEELSVRLDTQWQAWSLYYQDLKQLVEEESYWLRRWHVIQRLQRLEQREEGDEVTEMLGGRNHMSESQAFDQQFNSRLDVTVKCSSLQMQVSQMDYLKKLKASYIQWPAEADLAEVAYERFMDNIRWYLSRPMADWTDENGCLSTSPHIEAAHRQLQSDYEDWQRLVQQCNTERVRDDKDDLSLSLDSIEKQLAAEKWEAWKQCHQQLQQLSEEEETVWLPQWHALKRLQSLEGSSSLASKLERTRGQFEQQLAKRLHHEAEEKSTPLETLRRNYFQSFKSHCVRQLESFQKALEGWQKTPDRWAVVSYTPALAKVHEATLLWQEVFAFRYRVLASIAEVAQQAATGESLSQGKAEETIFTKIVARYADEHTALRQKLTRLAAQLHPDLLSGEVNRLKNQLRDCESSLLQTEDEELRQRLLTEQSRWQRAYIDCVCIQELRQSDFTDLMNASEALAGLGLEEVVEMESKEIVPPIQPSVRLENPKGFLECSSLIENIAWFLESGTEHYTNSLQSNKDHCDEIESKVSPEGWTRYLHDRHSEVQSIKIGLSTEFHFQNLIQISKRRTAQAEQARKQAEQARKQAEQARKQAEQGRKQAEQELARIKELLAKQGIIFEGLENTQEQKQETSHRKSIGSQRGEAVSSRDEQRSVGGEKNNGKGTDEREPRSIGLFANVEDSSGKIISDDSPELNPKLVTRGNNA